MADPTPDQPDRRVIPRLADQLAEQLSRMNTDDGSNGAVAASTAAAEVKGVGDAAAQEEKVSPEGQLPGEEEKDAAAQEEKVSPWEEKKDVTLPEAEMALQALPEEEKKDAAAQEEEKSPEGEKNAGEALPDQEEKEASPQEEEKEDEETPGGAMEDEDLLGNPGGGMGDGDDLGNSGGAAKPVCSATDFQSTSAEDESEELRTVREASFEIGPGADLAEVRRILHCYLRKSWCLDMASFKAQPKFILQILSPQPNVAAKFTSLSAFQIEKFKTENCITLSPNGPAVCGRARQCAAVRGRERP